MNLLLLPVTINKMALKDELSRMIDLQMNLYPNLYTILLRSAKRLEADDIQSLFTFLIVRNELTKFEQHLPLVREKYPFKLPVIRKLVIIYDRVDMARLVIQEMGDVESVRIEFSSPFEVAARNNSCAMLEFLHLHTVDSLSGDKLWHIYMNAIREDREQTVRFFIQSQLTKADDEQIPGLKGNYYRPISDAFHYGSRKVLKELLSSTTCYDYFVKQGRKIIDQLIADQDLELLDLILKRGANPNSQSGWTVKPVVQAVQIGNLDILERLLQAQVKVNTSILAQIQPPIQQLIRMILDRQWSVNHHCYTWPDFQQMVEFMMLIQSQLD